VCEASVGENQPPDVATGSEKCTRRAALWKTDAAAANE
jgi:hypothetical protein